MGDEMKNPEKPLVDRWAQIEDIIHRSMTDAILDRKLSLLRFIREREARIFFEEYLSER